MKIKDDLFDIYFIYMYDTIVDILIINTFILLYYFIQYGFKIISFNLMYLVHYSEFNFDQN